MSENPYANAAMVAHYVDAVAAIRPSQRAAIADVLDAAQEAAECIDQAAPRHGQVASTRAQNRAVNAVDTFYGSFGEHAAAFADPRTGGVPKNFRQALLNVAIEAHPST